MNDGLLNVDSIIFHPCRSLNDPPVPDASSQMSKSLEQDLTTFLDSSGREFCDIVLRLGDVPVAAHKVEADGRRDDGLEFPKITTSKRTAARVCGLWECLKKSVNF